MLECPHTGKSAKDIAHRTLQRINEIGELETATPEERIAAAIEWDLSDRSGLKHAWLNLTPEMRFHITEVWREIVRQELGK